MAARVNKKFVAILVSVAVVVCGTAVAAWYFLYTKSGADYERIGDVAMQEERFQDARSAYASAVAHDPTNPVWLEKWFGAIEQIRPPIQSAYQNTFYQSYRPVLRQIAHVKRTDIEAHDEYLSLLLRWSEDGAGSRQMAEGVLEEVEFSLSFFQGLAADPFATDPAGGSAGDDAEPEPWERLRRYRGIVLANLLAGQGTLSREEYDQAMDDLDVALRINPADDEATVAKVRLLLSLANQSMREDRPTEADRRRQAGREAVTALLEADPENPHGRVFRLVMDMEMARVDAGLQGGFSDLGERVELSRQTFAAFDADLREVGEWLASYDGQIRPVLLQALRRLEGLVGQDASFRITREVLDRQLEVTPDNERYLLLSGIIASDSREYDLAVERFSTLEELPVLPMSLRGLVRFQLQTEAPRRIADAELRRAADDTLPEEDREAALQRAREARDRYAKLVAEDDPGLLLTNGQIAEAEGDHQAAINLFAEFNEQTSDLSSDGLWREASAAVVLGRLGQASERLERMLDLEPNSLRAIVKLAEVKELIGQSRTQREALDLSRRALSLQPPENLAQFIRDRIVRLEILTGVRRATDPVTDALVQARSLAIGDDETPGDPSAAIELLHNRFYGEPLEGEERAPEGVAYDPRLARSLASRLLNADRFTEAKGVIEQARMRHRDEEMLQRLSTMLEADSIDEALVLMIERSEASQVDKLLDKFRVYTKYQRFEDANQALTDALEADPDNITAIELGFVRALARGDRELARELTDRAVELNADNIGGLTYEGRFASAEGDHQRAADLFEEATQRASVDASVWRLLARERQSLGRMDDAVDAFQTALRIRPDDIPTINSYVAALATDGRVDDALEEARRLRPYAERDPLFANMYFRLEATAGGDTGRRLAIQQRERLLSEQPDNLENKFELAELYIEDRRWTEARQLIDLLREENDSLELVILSARWHADQGRVRVDGEWRDGIDLARAVFIRHIVENDSQEVGVDSYLALARFMIQRGQYSVAIRALDDARSLQDPSLMRVEKLFGDLMLSLERSSEAADSFRRIVEAGADDEQQNYRKRLIEMLLRLGDYDEAQAQIAELGGEADEDLTLILQRADVLLGTGQQDEALALLDQAANKFSDNPLVFAKRAQALLTVPERRNEVIRNLDRALELDPNDWRTLKLRAAVHFQEGRPDDGIGDLLDVLRANPTLDDVLIGLMIEMIRDGRDGDALDAAIEVIDQRPTDSTLMIASGRVFSDRELWSRAAVLFRRAWDLTQDPRLGVRYIDALVNSDPPDTDQAALVLQRIGEVGEDIETNPQMLISAALIEVKQGNVARAESFLDRSFENLGGDPVQQLNWQRNVSRIFRNLGEGRDLAYLRSLLREQQNLSADERRGDTLGWLRFGIARLLLEDEATIAEGESDLRVLASDLAQPDVLRLLSHRVIGSFRYARDEFQQAAAAWEAGLENFPNDWEMNNNLAYCLAHDLGRPDEGEPYAQRAVEGNRSSANPWDTLARVQMMRGDLEGAAQSLLEADRRVRTTRERLDVLLNRVRLALAEGKLDAAERFIVTAETTTETLPDLRDQFAEDMKSLRAQIDSAKGRQ